MILGCAEDDEEPCCVFVDITNPWPIIGVGNIDRRMEFGNACQLPDGRWVEKPFRDPYTGKWEVRR